MARAADRRRYLSTRGALRRILAGYLRVTPSSIEISYSESGKPSLADVSAPTEKIHFSVSHSADAAIVAVCPGRRVGVDMERVRPLRGRDDVLSDFFSRAERDWVHSHGDGGEDDAFFQAWTRREASSKAVGARLIESFLRFSVPAAPYSPGGFRLALAEPGARSAEPQEWWIRDFVPAAGHAGALCTEKENLVPAFWLFAW